MPPTDVLCSTLLDEAEQQLGAFLRAAIDVVGVSGLRKASDIWFQLLETLEWPEKDFEKFFRIVSIQATAQLVEYSKVRFSREKNFKMGDWRAALLQRA